MPRTPAIVSITAPQAAAFRLARQHLATSTRQPAGSNVRPGPSIAGICRDSAGIQAQVQSSAETAIWTRRRATTRDEVRRALWDTREIVKTSAMRLTLHLIPAADFDVYIAAMRPSSLGTLQRWQARVGASPADVRAMIDTVVDALDAGPLTQQYLISRARTKARKGVRTWLEHAWSGVRPAVIEGRIVYGPPRGSEATFVRADTWLRAPGRTATVDRADAGTARAELLWRFLSAFGPASAPDFAKWSGIKTSDARRVLQSVSQEVTEVSVDGASGWIQSADLDALRRSTLDPAAVRLLGAFDSFLLAHATKEHLVDAAHYKRVYRPQGWISPVVLRGGTVAGVWFPKTDSQRLVLEVELFTRPTRALRQAIEAEAAAISVLMGRPCAASFT